MCLPPACFETGFGIVSGFEEAQSPLLGKNRARARAAKKSTAVCTLQYYKFSTAVVKI
jgi:hypothetical protein